MEQDCPVACGHAKCYNFVRSCRDENRKELFGAWNRTVRWPAVMQNVTISCARAETKTGRSCSDHGTGLSGGLRSCKMLQFRALVQRRKQEGAVRIMEQDCPVACGHAKCYNFVRSCR